jgi:hypothetical protein
LRIASLAAKAYQLPVGLRCERASAASMMPGRASWYVGRWFAHCSRGSTWNGELFAHRARSDVTMLIAPAALPVLPAFAERAIARGLGPYAACGR